MGCHPSTARRRMRAAGGRLVGGRLVVESRYLEAFAAQRVGQVLAGWGFDPGRVAALLAHGSGDGSPAVVTELDGWVTTEEARRLLRVRRSEALRLLAGLERRGSGRRLDPFRYRRADVHRLMRS